MKKCMSWCEKNLICIYILMDSVFVILSCNISFLHVFFTVFVSHIYCASITAYTYALRCVVAFVMESVISSLYLHESSNCNL